MLNQFNNGGCPDCGGFEMLAGPRGAACQNIECANCGAAFNVGPMVFERIGWNHSGRWKLADERLLTDGHGK